MVLTKLNVRLCPLLIALHLDYVLLVSHMPLQVHLVIEPLQVSQCVLLLMLTSAVGRHFDLLQPVRGRVHHIVCDKLALHNQALHVLTESLHYELINETQV
eukprot:GFUD01129772.1.p1 GENE.GFUD01129772.1~~GFUD01129772.1.p1  ORF type:complete len:101 (+),score=6.86 GFUD01129772.1:70-372(+)